MAHILSSYFSPVKYPHNALNRGWRGWCCCWVFMVWFGLVFLHFPWKDQIL